MTTKQFPKRRETDEQAAKRVAKLEARKEEFMKQPIKLKVRDLGNLGKRRISSSGRLV